jgi:hypothetical protein
VNTTLLVARFECEPRWPATRRGRPAITSGASRITHHASRLLAFTLLEILVAVALLSFIVLGLFAMFNQTQRAFRNSMTQSDILEAGRAVTEMIPRDLEQIAPSMRNALNFYTAVLPAVQPLTQKLPGAIAPNTLVRTNYLEDVFLLLRDNQTWVGIGYCVRTNDANGRLWLPEASAGQLGAGTLYRFTATLPYLQTAKDPRPGLAQDPNQLYYAFRSACNSGSAASLNISNRICDGVVHFHFRCFATNGFALFSDSLRTNACFRTNGYPNGWTVVRQSQASFSSICPDNLSALLLWSNAVPAAVEMELGLLEQYALERYNSIGSATARLNYLQREETSTRVHLFRQRIPIRNVDPSAYQ